MRTQMMLLSLVLLSAAAQAGPSGGGGVGNGGGAWTCRVKTPDRALIWVDLVDLSEARREFGLDVPGAPSVPAGPVAASDLPGGAEFERWLRHAETRLWQANPVFYSEYRVRADDIRGRIFVPQASDFRPTTDIFYRTRPAASTCPGGVISEEPEQLANFTTRGHLLINPELWNSPALSAAGRAALYVHEALYWLLRLRADDHDSVRTREIVGYLMSDKPVDQFAFLIALPVDRPFTPEPKPGIYGELAARFADIEITHYDRRRKLLYLTERDRDRGGKPLASSVFRCSPDGSELACSMTSTTSASKRRRGLVSYGVRFSEAGSFVWFTTRDGEVRSTRYRELGR